MTDFLHGVEVVEIQEGVRPIRTVKSAVIGLVGTAPIGPVNTPTLIAGSRAAGVAKFGSGAGTIPDALAAIFRQHGAAVVVVNVADPDGMGDYATREVRAGTFSEGKLALGHRWPHNLALRQGEVYAVGDDYTVDNAGVVSRVAAGAIPAGATVTIGYTDSDGNPAAIAERTFVGAPGTIDLGGAVTGLTVARLGDAYQAGRDYTLDAASGIVTRPAESTIAADATFMVDYVRLDLNAVPASDIEGGVDQVSGAYTGVSALLGAGSVVGHTPRILIAPGYSDTKAVAAALVSTAARLRAVASIEGPSTTDLAAQKYRQDFGSRRAYLVDPDVLVADGDDDPVTAPNSAYVAGVIARSDAERGFWWSPSNRVILGVVGTQRPIDFTLGDPNARANLLNEHDVATIIREQGFRLWGNRTCSDDPAWAFLSVVRTADAINDSILRAHLWAVDRGITRTYFDEVAGSVNAYLRELVGLGAILGGRCSPTPDLNTKATLAAGRAYFDFDFTPSPPAERITFRSRITNDYLEEILDDPTTDAEEPAA